VRVQLRSPGQERGTIAIIVAVLATFLIGLAAFSVDVGMVLAQRQAISTGADSAALAIVREQLRETVDNPRSCQELAADPTVHQQAEATALAQVNANAPFNRTIPAEGIQTDLYCVDAGGNRAVGGKVLEAAVTVSQNVETYLAGVFNRDSDHIAVNRVAVANLGVANDLGGALPLALCIHQAEAIMEYARTNPPAEGDPYPAVSIEVDRVWTEPSLCKAPTKGASGNWGWLDLTEEKGGDGTRKLADMIRTGHGGTIDLTGPTYELDGTPGAKGNSNRVHEAMESRMDQKVTLPVYDKYDEDKSGQNARYNIVGFLSVQLCGYDNGSERGACYDASVPGFPDDLQVRFVDYFSPQAAIGALCELNDACAFNAYVTALTG
jgi:hypothetical protein